MEEFKTQNSFSCYFFLKKENLSGLVPVMLPFHRANGFLGGSCSLNSSG